MAHPVVSELVATVTNTVGVMESAKVLISGFAAKLAAAIAEALANGATQEELEPLVALETEVENKTAELAAAVAANPTARR